MSKTEKAIMEIKKRILDIGPLHPGSINRQFNVCGKANCKCKDPEHPVKHGPYYQLSYAVSGRSTSRFLKPEEVDEAKRRIRAYQKLKRLIEKLVEANVILSREEGFRKEK